MSNIPPISPAVAIANVLEKRTVEGREMRRKRIILSRKQEETAETGLAVLLEALTAIQHQHALTDEIYTALAWKVAAHVAKNNPVSNPNFLTEMARVGYYLSLNPDLITRRPALSSIIEQELSEQRRSRLKATCNPSFPDLVLQWRAMAVGKPFQVCWRSTDGSHHAESITYDGLLAIGMPSPHSRNAPLAHLQSLEHLRTGRMKVYLLRRDTTPLVLFITHEADLTSIRHQQPFIEQSWQALAEAYIDLTKGLGQIKLEPHERLRLTPYLIAWRDDGTRPG